MLFWSLACASHGLATGFGMLAVSRLLLGVGEGGGFPAATRAVAEWFPVTRAIDGDGDHQRRHRRRRRDRAAADRAGASRHADWRWVFYLTGAIGLVWAVWWWREYYPPEQHPRLGAAERSCSQPVIAAAARPEPTPRWLDAAAGPADVGAGRRQVPERRRLVLLPLLAAEVSLRRARLRHQAGRRLRLDSATRPPASAACSAAGCRAGCCAAAAARSRPQDRARR